MGVGDGQIMRHICPQIGTHSLIAAKTMNPARGGHQIEFNQMKSAPLRYDHAE